MGAVLELGARAEVELAAVEVRERLLGFVAEVTRGLPHARQRENAGLYVRGLVEQGGRKSLSQRCFGWAGTLRVRVDAAVPGRTPWDPALVVRAWPSGSRRDRAGGVGAG